MNDNCPVNPCNCKPQSQPEVQQGERKEDEPTEAETHLNLTLCDLRLWIQRHLENLHHRENKTGYLGSQNPQGYAVAEIPDWELRQKLSNVIKCQENEHCNCASQPEPAKCSTCGKIENPFCSNSFHLEQNLNVFGEIPKPEPAKDEWSCDNDAQLVEASYSEYWQCDVWFPGQTVARAIGRTKEDAEAIAKQIVEDHVGSVNDALLIEIKLRDEELKKLRDELEQARAKQQEAEDICASKSNLLLNIADTLRSRGFPAGLSNPMDVRVIEMAQELDKARAKDDASQPIRPIQSYPTYPPKAQRARMCIPCET